MDAGQTYAAQQFEDFCCSWNLALRRALECNYLLAVYGLGVLWLAQRYGLERGRFGRWVAFHLCMSLVFTLLYDVTYAAVLHGQMSVKGKPFVFWETFRKLTVFMPSHVATYWFIVLIHHGWHYYRRYRERERRAAELEGQLARARLRHLLKKEPDFVIAGECANGREAVAAIQREAPDLVFLDVQMPSPNGFQVCAEVGVERMPCIVFVTAYDRYALRAFEVHAVDYLLKPIDAERFQGTLRLLRQRLRGDADKGGGGQRLGALLAELDLYRRAKERLAVRVDGRTLFLRTAEIEWLEAEGNYVRLHVGSAAHLVRDTLCALEADLPGERFLRISRSAIVNVDAVKELQPLFYGDHVVILRDGTRLTLSRNYRDRLKRLLPH